jgi:Membrane protein involved in the export of O-antigen and teichoic acid
MSGAKKIVTNTLVITISQIINYGLGFIFTAYMARYLQADSFGMLSAGISITQFFAIFADFGLHILMIREVSKDKASAGRYLGNIVAIKCGLMLAALAAIALMASFGGYTSEGRTVIYIMSLSMVFFSFSAMFYAFFQAFDNMKYQAFGLILTSLIMLSGTAVACSLRLGVVYFAAIYLISNLLVFLYAFSACTLKFLRPQIRFEVGFWKNLAGEAAPFGISNMFSTVYVIFGTIALSFVQDYQAVGLYSAAYRLITYLLIVPGIVNMAIFPTMSSLSVSSRESLKFLCHKYQKVMILAGLPIAFSFTALADKIISFIYGSSFSGSTFALQIMIWSVIFTYVAAPMVLLCMAIGKQTLITRVTGLAMIVNVALNLLLIPVFSYLGASIVTLANEAIVISLVYFFAYRLGYSLPVKKLTDITFRVAISSLIMVAFIFVFHDLPVVALLPMAFIVYAIAVLLLRGVDDADLDLAKSVLKREHVYV